MDSMQYVSDQFWLVYKSLLLILLEEKNFFYLLVMVLETHIIDHL